MAELFGNSSSTLLRAFLEDPTNNGNLDELAVIIFSHINDVWAGISGGALIKVSATSIRDFLKRLPSAISNASKEDKTQSHSTVSCIELGSSYSTEGIFLCAIIPLNDDGTVNMNGEFELRIPSRNDIVEF